MYANGNRYNGDWVNGRITGTGVLTFADGERYEGELKDGRMQVPASAKHPHLDTACQLIFLHTAGAGYLHLCEWRPVRRGVEG